MATENLQQILESIDLDTAEHEAILDCLMTMIEHAQKQYNDNEAYKLPVSSNVLSLSTTDKFELLKIYISSLRV